MTQYLITKREKCERYEYYGAGHANCKTCDGTGNIDTSVDLLTALNEARINDIVCDCGDTHWGTVEGDEGQMLEWICPKTGEKNRAVNA